MKKLINDYFKKVEIYKIVVLNIILGILASYPIMLSSIFMFGLFVKPTIIERLIGLIIFVSAILIIIILNYLLYKIDKKQADNKKGNLWFAITIIIVIILSCSFFLFPNTWLDIWGYVF